MAHNDNNNEKYGSQPMKAAEPGAMQGHRADTRTTAAVFAVAGFVLLAFLATIVVMIVIFSQEERRPDPMQDPEPVPSEQQRR